MNAISKFLNAHTMYRIVLYGLAVLAVIAILLSSFSALAYTGLQLLLSLAILFGTCLGTNIFFAHLFKVPANMESWAITALILFFVLSPATSLASALTLALAGILAMAVKYIFAVKQHHLFNPAAAAAFLLGIVGSGAASWWVASSVFTPFVVIIGFLVVAKMRRFPMVITFLIASLGMIAVYGAINGLATAPTILEALVSWPIFFFAAFMLTEPLTAPGTKAQLLAYGALVGLLFCSQFHFGPVYATPEFALLAGNLFAFLISRRKKLQLSLIERKTIAKDVYEFAFAPNVKPEFAPGQYLEWTMPMQDPDNRGNRRYFTIASSPTEKQLLLGVRIAPEQSSSFKASLLTMKPGDTIVADQLSGDFVLPTDPARKLVFIAGGIGITPFRSMIKYLTDTKQQRDIVLFYCAMSPDAFAYGDIFDEAKRAIGLRTINVLSGLKNPADAPKDWPGKVGYITADMLRAEVPDFAERTFYLSGPSAMVNAYEDVLLSLNVSRRNIKIDYFPGF